MQRFALLLCLASAWAEDWAQWRGTNRAGHLKRWYFFGDEVMQKFRPEAEIYGCEHCRTLYLPSNEEQPRTGTLSFQDGTVRRTCYTQAGINHHEPSGLVVFPATCTVRPGWLLPERTRANRFQHAKTSR